MDLWNPPPIAVRAVLLYRERKGEEEGQKTTITTMTAISTITTKTTTANIGHQHQQNKVTTINSGPNPYNCQLYQKRVLGKGVSWAHSSPSTVPSTITINMIAATAST